MAGRSIEKKPSSTAAYNCLSRACAARERDARFRGPDDMAEVFIPFFPKHLILNIPLMRRLFLTRMIPPGIYQYVLARTKLIDEVFMRALDEDFAQIALLGAGFDTRAIRFQVRNKATRIYELDAPTTQEAKVDILRRKNVSLPESLVFVPIDFNKESIHDVLVLAGFEHARKTLFVYEGVTMYLTPDAVDAILRFVRTSSEAGSLVVFDYVQGSVLRGENRYFGEEGIVRTVTRVGEGWTFGIEEGEVERFLSERGFKVVSHHTASDLEHQYLTADDGTRFGRVNGTHCIVVAAVGSAN
jgi:methyltransferase (TIGR00027 family)